MQPSQNNISALRLKYITKHVKTLLLAFCVIGVTVASVLFLRAHFSSPYKFRYTTTSNYVFSIRPQGQGISFDKPTQFQVTGENNDQVEIQHYVNVGGKNYFVGFISASRSFLPASLTDQDLATLGSIFSSSSNKDYSTTLANFQKFVGDRVPVGWSPKYDPVAKFANKTISKNAWSMEFSASGKNSNPKGSKLVRGKAVMVITNYYTYYFMAYTFDYNWQLNMATWNKTFNSLMVGI